MGKIIPKNIWAIIFLLVFTLTFVLRLLIVTNHNFPFTTDQGRDMLDLREIVYGSNLKLTGPTTSINGVFLGPFYYYFNLIPFVVGRGDPAYLIYWQILWYQLAGLAIYFYLKKVDLKLAFVFSLLFLLMPLGFYTSRFSWSAHPMPILMVFYFISLHLNITRPSRLSLIILGLLSGIGLQIEAALGILIFPFSLIALFLHRTKWKNFIPLISGFAITIIPQLLFEIKHQFVMTQTLIGEFFGKTDIVSNSLPLSGKYSHLFQQYQQLIYQTNHLHPNLVFVIFTVGVITLIYLGFKKIHLVPCHQLYWLSLGFILLSFCFYLLVPVEIKHWYLYGLSVPIILIISMFLTYLWNNSNKLLRLTVIAILIWVAFTSLDIHTSYFLETRNQVSPDPSNLRNELAAIDRVYQQASGQGFRIYNYIPSVYDFPYQYLFWWYGTSKYGYQPDTISYLPNVPEYIPHHAEFWTQKQPMSSDSFTFLIIEPDEFSDRQQRWFGNFASLCTAHTHTFPWGTTVEARHQC